jgi:hypothetical protein
MIPLFLIENIPQNANICIFGKNDHIMIDLLKNYNVKSEKFFMNKTKKSYYKDYFFNTSNMNFKVNHSKEFHKKFINYIYNKEIPKICIIEEDDLIKYNTTIMKNKKDHIWFHNHTYQISTICMYDFDLTPAIKRENIDIIFLFYDSTLSLIYSFYERYISKEMVFEDFYEIYIKFTKNNKAIVLFSGNLYYYKPNVYSKIYLQTNVEIDSDQEVEK